MTDAGVLPLMRLPKEFATAICRRPGLRPAPGRPTLWETVPNMRSDSLEVRMVQAQKLCRKCPVLELCAARVDELAAAKIPIDGVVAGRLPDRGISARCRDCGREFNDELMHFRSGLCRSCHREKKGDLA